ncbi:MAG: cell division protein FtsL [Rickettsiales bacterium]
MSRLATVVWMLVIVVAAFLLYRVKYEVQALKVQIAEAEQQLEKEQELLHVVAAEWAYLNRPERLQKLSKKYLSSGNVTVEQIAEVEAIPFPQVLEASSDSNGSASNVVPVSAVSLQVGAGE